MSMHDKMRHHIGQTAKIRNGLLDACDKVYRLIKISELLGENLYTCKRLHGDKWKSRTADLRGLLKMQMEATGETNPIAVATPVISAMARDGENPAMLIAVATDMAIETNQKHSQ
jgi:hypothetical protein